MNQIILINLINVIDNKSVIYLKRITDIKYPLFLFADYGEETDFESSAEIFEDDDDTLIYT